MSNYATNKLILGNKLSPAVAALAAALGSIAIGIGYRHRAEPNHNKYRPLSQLGNLCWLI